MLSVLRRLTRAPGFAAVIILTIGLVVGVDATIFTALNALMLRELPVRNADRLVRVVAVMPRGETREEVPWGDYLAMRDAATNVSVAAFTMSTVTVIEPLKQKVVSVRAESVSTNFFDVLATPRSRGGGDVIVSRDLERRMFEGDAIGKVIVIDGKAHAITGVAGGAFRGTNLVAPSDLWIPLVAGADRGVRIIGRLAEGATVAAAEDALSSGLPDRKRISRVRVGPERAMLINPDTPGAVQASLIVALCLVTLAALVAASNVIGILFARLAVRRRDLAIRVALGATPGALMRQVVAETLPLALPAALLAWLIASVASRFYFSRLPMQSRPELDLAPDARVAVFVLAVSCAAVLFAALAAALYARRTATSNLSSRGGSQPTPPLLRWIVAAQLALCTVVLVAAGLLIRTARAYHAVDPGFEYAKQLDVTLRDVPLPRAREIAARLRASSGVTSVAIASTKPLGRQKPMTFRDRGGEPIEGVVVYVDGDYLEALNIPLVRGSGLEAGDMSGRAVVSKAMADRRPAFEMAGVIGNVRFGALAETPIPYVFLPIEQAPALPVAYLLLRTTRDPAAASRDVNAILTSIGLPPTAHPLADTVATDRWLAETASVIGSTLGVLTLLLAAIGLFGVVSASVVSRGRELAIRTACGATRADLGLLIAGSSVRLLAAGGLLGVLLAIPAASALGSVLFGTDPFDAVTWTAVALVIAATVSAATILPARKAMGVNPIELLREI